MFTVVYHSIALENKAESQQKREEGFPNRSKAWVMKNTCKGQLSAVVGKLLVLYHSVALRELSPCVAKG